MSWLEITIFHCTAWIHTFSLIQEEVRVALKTLILWWTCATLAILVASGAGGCLDVETYRALWHAWSIVAVVEGKKVKLWLAWGAISKSRAGLASRITLPATSALLMCEITRRTWRYASAVMQIGLRRCRRARSASSQCCMAWSATSITRLASTSIVELSQHGTIAVDTQLGQRVELVSTLADMTASIKQTHLTPLRTFLALKRIRIKSISTNK